MANDRLSPKRPVGTLVGGPWVVSGYFADEAASAAVVAPDGWFHTGDMATIGYCQRQRVLGYFTASGRERHFAGPAI